MAVKSPSPNQQQKSWNFLATLFYVVCIVGLGYLLERRGFEYRSITLGDISLMVLATYRLTRILVFDKIFKLFRDFIKRKEKLYVFYVVREIITCPWCAGVWVALVVFTLYYLVPYGSLFIILLAVSGVAAFIVVLVNYIGLSTEEKQARVKELRRESDYTKP